jgi:hypothetical protein
LAAPPSEAIANADAVKDQGPAPLTEDDPELPWSKRLTLRVTYGMTFVNKPYNKAMNMQGAIGYRSHSWFESGFSYRKEQALYDDNINFPATGYQETRSYQLDTMLLAPYISFRFSPSLSLLVSAGLSSSISTLSSVTTDAPTPSTLAPGYNKQAAWCPAYHAGLSYEYLLGSIGLGLEIGYGSSSSNPDANLKGVYAAGLLTLRTGTSAKQTTPETPPETPPGESSTDKVKELPK